jgi:hypothetical protein
MRVVSLVLALFVLAACGSNDHPRRPGPSLPTVPAPVATDALDAAFLNVMHGYMPGAPDPELLAIGHGVCRELGAGWTRAQLVDGFVHRGMSSKTARVTIVASVITYCPGRKSDV